MAEAIFGINSNLDTASLISDLVSLEARPIDLVEAKKAIEEEKLTTFQDLKSRLQTFKSVATTINTESRFVSTQGIFSNNNANDNNEVVEITTTSQASSGTFSLVINNLAQETKIVTDGFASTTSTIPSTAPVVLTVGNTTKTFTIDSSNNTVDGLRLLINNSGLDVKATFLNDGDPDTPIRLLISGTNTGTSGAVTISQKETLLGGGQQDLQTFTTTQFAQNASLSLDGISITKSSNTVTDVINGAALSLKSPGSGAITLSSDVTAMVDKISDFVEAYNELILFLDEQLALDTETNETGVLFGNYTVQNIQQTLRSTVSGQVSGITGDFEFLSQIGITTQSDGTLIIDKGTLTDAINADTPNISQLFSSKGTTTNSSVTFVGFTNDTQPGTFDIRVQNGVPQVSNSGENNYTDAVGSGNFFAGAAGTDAEGLNFRISSTATDGDFGSITLSIGVAEALNRFLNDLVDTSLNGPLSSEIDTINDTIEDFDNTIDDMQQRLVLFEENLRARFTNLEIVLGQLNSQRDTFTNSLSGIQNLFQNNG